LTDPLLDLPYSYGLLLKYKLIPARTSAVNVMRVMQRVARYPSVAKKRRQLFSIQTILRLMSPRTLAALRKAVV
jgi:hypothetical protein